MASGLAPQRADAHVSNWRSALLTTTTRNTCDTLRVDALVAGVINGVANAMENPILAQGDLVVGGAAGKPMRQPLGVAHTVLTSDGTTVMWDVASSDVITTEGDLIVGDVTGAESRLPIGAPSAVLTSTGTTAAWTAPATVITTQGDLIVGNVSGNESRLPIGAANTTLTSNGTTAQWQAPVTTTQGDLIVGGVAGAPMRLPVGVATRVLTSDGTTPQWLPIPAPSALAVQYSNVQGLDPVLQFGSVAVAGSYDISSLINNPSYVTTVAGAPGTSGWFEFAVAGNYLVEFSMSCIVLATVKILATLSTNSGGVDPFLGTEVILAEIGIPTGTETPRQCLYGRLLVTAAVNETFGIVIQGADSIAFDSQNTTFTVQPLF